MVRAYFKYINRTLISNIIRFLTISLVIAIGICIVCALGGLPEQIRDSVEILSTPTQSSKTAEITADKIEMIALIFPVFFIAVSALTALITLTRLIEEERPMIACLKTLGYSRLAIISKYILFAFICATVGSVIGILLGNYVLSPILYDSIKIKFEIPDSPNSVYIVSGLIWSVIMTCAVIFTAFYISFQKSKENPASILRSKAPKAGEKILLERIPFIWKPLKFKYKSSLRNIIRYKSRLIMTVLSILGSSALVFCGFGLYNSLNGLKNENEYGMSGLVESIIPISTAIIICATVLTMLVLFNLTNINIEERKREIATLKVLGYKKTEIFGYIFREIFILALTGTALGIPIGYYLLGFIFEYLEFGSLDFVEWYVWLLTAAISILSVLLTDILLIYKISKIEMHISLKIIE